MSVIGPAIRPGEPDWFIWDEEQLEINSFAALAPDKFVFSARVLDGRYDRADPYSRIYRVDGEDDWLFNEVEDFVEGMVPLQPAGQAHSGVAILTQRGDVWLPGCELPDEHVTGHGYETGYSSKCYMTWLGSHQGELFASGMDGCYLRRSREGIWSRDDDGMFMVVPKFPRKRPVDEGELAVLDCISTFDGGDFYASGTTCFRPSLAWRPQGASRWEWLQIEPSNERYDFMMLLDVHAFSNEKVWLATDGPMQFVGNGREGFREIAPIALIDGEAPRIKNFITYAGELYAGGNGCYRRTKTGRWEELTGPPSRSIDPYEPHDGRIRGKLHVGGGCLWAVSEGGISRFDGREWKRFEIPQTYRNPQRRA